MTETALTMNTALTTSAIITSRSDVESGPRSPGLSVQYSSSPINPAPRPATGGSSTTSSVAQHVKEKKKPSFLGTLFTKEPSTDAFLQMQNESRKQLALSPGRKIPPGMSGVSSVKMPEHIPSVNSKWDGMPRRSEESGKRKSRPDSRRTSTLASSTRSRSADPSGRRRHSRPVSGSTTSSDHPLCGRSSNSVHPEDSRVRSGDIDSRAESISSRNSIKHPLSSRVSLHTESLRPQSGDSFPNYAALLAKIPSETSDVHNLYRAPTLTGEPSQMSSKDESTKGGLMVTDSYFEIAPALVSSPSSTPPAQSPITPYFEVVSEQCPDESGIQEHDSLACSMAELKLNEGPLRAGEARPISLSGKRTPSVQTQSTHKSEARPRLFAPAVLVQQDLEKRPDSSRARLGLRASIIRNADGAPWELKRQKIQQDLEKRPDSSRARLGLRASIIRNADAAPWEVNDEKRHRSDSLTNSSSPKHLLSKSLGIFGKV